MLEVHFVLIAIINSLTIEIEGTFETNSDWDLENLSIVAVVPKNNMIHFR